jgi:hypothetical protein
MRHTFELSERTKKLVAFLRYVEKGTEISYRDLAQQIGEPVDAKSSTYARLVLLRDFAAVFACLPRIGLRRLTDLEIADRLPSFWLNGARNKLKRGGAQADVVDIHHLDIDQQVAFSVNCIQRELAQESLSKQTRRKMEKVARGTSNDLPAFTAVEWAISLSPKNTYRRGE